MYKRQQNKKRGNERRNKNGLFKTKIDMTSILTKRKMFIIATCMFLVTMSTVLFIVGEGKLEIEKHDLSANIIQEFDDLQNKTEKDYREMLNLKDGDFVVVNNKREFIYIAPTLEELHGYKLSENVGLNSLSLIHPKDLVEFAYVLLEYNKNPHLLEDAGPIRIKTIEGNFVTYLIDLHPIFNKNYEKIASVVVLKNISTPLGDQKEDSL